ncbi:MAG: di-trans,poly-cis-decaprenylcistransferase [Proteobacteria bacterium]|nr:di-trans,poly-cis-decaprenylcistransferase [Pseudomonadota bacterium]
MTSEKHKVENSTNKLPRHIAIVMDGNGRWAKQRRRPRTFGHRAGQKAVRATIEACLRRGIEALTLFAFSSENWQRPKDEVGALMELFLKALDREVDELHGYGVRIRFIGELAAFAPALRERMQTAMAKTSGNAKLALNIAVNYGGRWDIAQAARQAAQAAVRGEIDAALIDEARLAGRFALAELPPLDLFIRTGGEKRVSNFLLWQLAYAELYFSDALWPDFDAAHLDAAIADFAGRERRYGKTSAQMGTEKHGREEEI